MAHCLLNQNSKTDGGARCPGIYSPLVDLLRERGWRIEQMPCPEHAFLGMHRFWLVKDQADTLAFRRHCRRQAKVVAGAIAVHVERGTDVVVIGVEGSPSMGVRITSSSADWGGRPDKGDDDYPLVPGRGIFSEELRGRARRARAGRRARERDRAPAARATTRRPSASRSAPCWSSRVEGDARGFRIAVCADVLVNPEPGGLDALEVCGARASASCSCPPPGTPTTSPRAGSSRSPSSSTSTCATATPSCS